MSVWLISIQKLHSIQQMNHFNLFNFILLLWNYFFLPLKNYLDLKTAAPHHKFLVHYLLDRRLICLYISIILYTKSCLVFINFIPRVCSSFLFTAHTPIHTGKQPSHSNAITIFTECYTTWHSLSMNVYKYNTIHCIHISERFVFVHTPVNRSCVHRKKKKQN